MEKNLKVWFTSPQQKIRPRSFLTWGKVESYHIYVAKSATEGCQVSFMAPEERKNFTIEVQGERAEGMEIELLREHYVSCAGALWPDPVVPDDGHFDLEEKCNVTYLINVKTAADTPAGSYKFKVVLKENGKLYGRYSLKVTVWNFAINPTKHMDTGFGIEKKFLFLRQPTDDKEGLYKKYYDYMLDKYRICAFDLPYDILDPRVDAYLDDPRVTTFLIPYNVDDETIIKYRDKLCSKESWSKKGFFYVVDEPCNMEAYKRIEEMDARLTKLWPDYPAVFPFFKDPQDGGGVRAVDLLEKFSKVWCPKINLYKEKWFCDYMHNRDAVGNRVWWYVCWEPGLPYSNVFIDMDGFHHRVLLWQQYLYEVRGLLYWTTTWWRDLDPWDGASTVQDLSYYVFGDGSLFYPGNRVGIDGPVGSLRFEVLRSGIEDFYMLQMAEEAFGRKYVERMIKNVSKSVREYNDDHEALDKTRISIGNKLSKYFSEV